MERISYRLEYGRYAKSSKNKMLQMAILKLIMCLVIGRYVRGCLGMQMKMWNPAL